MLIFIALLLASLVKSDQSATTLPIDKSLQHVPFGIHDQINPNSYFQRFPQRKLLIRPEILTRKLLSLPWDLRDRSYYFSITAFNGSVVSRCHTKNCLYREGYTRLVERYVGQNSIQSIVYIILIVRDECHVRLVHQYLQTQHIKEPQYSRSLEHLSNIVKSIPTWMMSLDLKNPFEKQNLLIPDGWILLWDFESERRKAQEGSRRYSWNQKSNKIFWRGGDSGVTWDYVDYWSDIARYFPRAELIRYSREYPEIVDARFTAILHDDDFKKKLRQMGLELTSGRVSVQDHIKYKYLISLDGWTAAWFRPQWIMCSNSLLVKQVSPKVEWFYAKMIPKKHYYPVAEDLSDLLEVYKYMEEHQEQMQNITKQANQFARQNFGRNEAEAVFFEILQQYINHQNFHSVFEPLMWPGRSFEDVLEKFNDNDREKILPPIGQIHLCKKQTEPVQTEIPTQTCQPDQSEIPPYISLVLIGLQFLYFFTRFRVMCLVKGVGNMKKNAVIKNDGIT